MKLSISNQYDLVDVRRVQWGDGVTLLIAPTSCKAYQDHMNAYLRGEQAQRAGFRRSASVNKQFEDSRREAMKQGIAEHIIRGWEGVFDTESGEEVAYTPDLGLDLLSDDSFFMDVVAAAGETDAYRRDRLEEAEGNSEVLSGTGGGSGSTTKRRGASSSGS